MYTSTGQNLAHSGQGRLVGNLITFVILFAVFLGAVFSLSYWTLETAWIPGILCIGGALVAFAIPQHILGISKKDPATAPSEK